MKEVKSDSVSSLQEIIVEDTYPKCIASQIDTLYQNINILLSKSRVNSLKDNFTEDTSEKINNSLTELVCSANELRKSSCLHLVSEIISNKSTAKFYEYLLRLEKNIKIDINTVNNILFSYNKLYDIFSLNLENINKNKEDNEIENISKKSFNGFLINLAKYLVKNKEPILNGLRALKSLESKYSAHIADSFNLKNSQFISNIPKYEITKDFPNYMNNPVNREINMSLLSNIRNNIYKEKICRFQPCDKNKLMKLIDLFSEINIESSEDLSYSEQKLIPENMVNSWFLYSAVKAMDNEYVTSKDLSKDDFGELIKNLKNRKDSVLNAISDEIDIKKNDIKTTKESKSLTESINSYLKKDLALLHTNTYYLKSPFYSSSVNSAINKKINANVEHTEIKEKNNMVNGQAHKDDAVDKSDNIVIKNINSDSENNSNSSDDISKEITVKNQSYLKSFAGGLTKSGSLIKYLSESIYKSSFSLSNYLKNTSVKIANNMVKIAHKPLGYLVDNFSSYFNLFFHGNNSKNKNKFQEEFNSEYVAITNNSAFRKIYKDINEDFNIIENLKKKTNFNPKMSSFKSNISKYMPANCNKFTHNPEIEEILTYNPELVGKNFIDRKINFIYDTVCNVIEHSINATGKFFNLIKPKQIVEYELPRLHQKIKTNPNSGIFANFTSKMYQNEEINSVARSALNFLKFLFHYPLLVLKIAYTAVCSLLSRIYSILKIIFRWLLYPFKLFIRIIKYSIRYLIDLFF